MNESAAARLADVLRRVPALKASFGDGRRATWVESHSNDVWRQDGRYLRVCWRGDLRRLEREAVVGRHLPAGVPYPVIVDAGVDDAYGWMVTEGVAGESLDRHWPSMSDDERRSAIHACGAALRALHRWVPPATVVDALATSTSDDAEDIVGSDVYPLPVARAWRLVEAAAALPYVDADLVARLRHRLDELAGADPFGAPGDEQFVVVHGDLSIANVVWTEAGVAAVLDFEWARLGPGDLDLLFFCAAPTPVEAWAFEAVPELFAHPRLRERQWLYALTYALRLLIVFKPETADAAARPDRALGRLRSYVEDVPPAVDRIVRACTS